MATERASRPPSSLPNLGPAMDRLLAEVGIETAGELRRVGAPMAYRVLQHRFGTSAITRVTLWALAGALAGRHMDSYSADERAGLEADADGDLEVGPRR